MIFRAHLIKLKNKIVVINIEIFIQVTYFYIYRKIIMIFSYFIVSQFYFNADYHSNPSSLIKVNMPINNTYKNTQIIKIKSYSYRQ